MRETEKQPSDHQGERRRRGKRCPRHHSRNSPAAPREELITPLQPEEDFVLEQVDVP